MTTTNGNPSSLESVPSQRPAAGIDPRLLAAVIEQALISLQQHVPAANETARDTARPFGGHPAAAGPKLAVTEPDELALQQRDLEHQIMRRLIETSPLRSVEVPSDLVAELREICQRRQAPQASRDAGTVLMTFAVKAITEAMAAIIASFEFLLHPASGYVSWYNDTDRYVHVMTFDQDDAVRWVRYEERVVAPKQVVRLTARGNTIHIKVSSNHATYDCDKNQSYLFDGQNCYPRLS